MPGCASLPMAACMPFATLHVARCRAICGACISTVVGTISCLTAIALCNALSASKIAVCSLQMVFSCDTLHVTSAAAEAVAPVRFALRSAASCRGKFGLGACSKAAWHQAFTSTPMWIIELVQPLAPVEYIASCSSVCLRACRLSEL